MNGQLYNLLKTVNHLNLVVTSKQFIQFNYEQYIDSLSFEVCEEKDFLNRLLNKSNELKVVNLEKFIKYLLSNECLNVVTNLSINNDDRNKSAYANGVSGQVMICNYANHYEVWRNNFNHNGEGWDVCYTFIGTNKGKFEPIKRDIKIELDKLIRCYMMLSEFATEIEEDHWANFFNKGKLKMEQINEDDDVETYIDQMMSPFGGMGSWNDSPPYSAHEKGLDDEFKRNSDELYRQMHIVLESVCNKSSSNIV
jgi:hypothetical protein